MTVDTDNLPEGACEQCLALGNKHLRDCPVATNWWTVKAGMGVVCSLCTDVLEEGDAYRLIPMEPDLDPAALEALIGKPKHEDHPVCGDCCEVRLVVDGMHPVLMKERAK